MKILRVTNDDLYKKSLELRVKVFVEEQGVSRDVEVDEFESIATSFVGLDEYDRVIVTGRYRLKGDSIKFERIATHPDYRRQGLGKMLMDVMVEASLQDFPGKTPYLHAQNSAIPFYEKLGWKICSEEFFEERIPHHAMHLK